MIQPTPLRGRSLPASTAWRELRSTLTNELKSIMGVSERQVSPHWTERHQWVRKTLVAEGVVVHVRRSKYNSPYAVSVAFSLHFGLGRRDLRA
jgi:hypothetical protein